MTDGPPGRRRQDVDLRGLREIGGGIVEFAGGSQHRVLILFVELLKRASWTSTWFFSLPQSKMFHTSDGPTAH